MEKYSTKEIEGKWQKWWEEKGVYNAKENGKKQKFYGLVEFPYPSGEGLHVGHPRSYTAIDIVTRKKRMDGKNVLYPMGWDAFGLPAENYAIKTKQKPAVVTEKNIANFKRQIQMLGTGFDWSREINTTDSKYYKWTQWMFIKFYNSYFDEQANKARLIEELEIPEDVRAQGEIAIREYRDGMRMAFKTKTTINWCPKDKIGLANEEAAGGVCDRCGGPVEKRIKEQWMLRITKYAQRLIDELDSVDYLEKIKTSQVNWIGRSEGALVNFQITNNKEQIQVFTTRPDTLFGATYMVLAPEHPLIENLEFGILNLEEVKTYQEAARKKSDLERQENKEKTGVELKGVKAINPATGKEIPIWIADYVLSGYGTGAIMAVPAHDERDFEFAKKFGLSVVPVVAYPVLNIHNPPREGKKESKREVIHAILRNPKDETYLVEYLKDASWGDRKPVNFVIGGVEEGEDPAETAAREIKEETGYSDIKLIAELPIEVKARFFQAQKDENRTSHVRTFVFELVTDKQEQVAAEESSKHEFKWVPVDNVAGELNIPTDQIVWRYHTTGGFAFADEGMAVNSGFLNGLETKEATAKIISWLEEQKIGKRMINYKLRDWVFSRQRYWGEPIPLVCCEKCGWVAIPESELPVLLPEVENYEPTDTGESPLAEIKDWVATKCPTCGGEARRETDTMPNWAGSSWYFLRYCDARNDQEFASSEKLKYWMPVDLYNGGMEHTTLHLLYSRFWYKVLFDLGYIPSECGVEPYKMRRSHAMILGEGGIKMSKSKGNVVNPDEVVGEFGADTFRTYEMFIGPYDADAPWSTQGIIGVKRFLEKVWHIADARITNYEFRITNDGSDSEFDRLLNFTVKKVGEDIENLRFNTAVSQLMILANEMSGKEVAKEDLETFLKLLAPFAPHMTEELWHSLGHEDSIHLSSWPEFDPAKIVAETVKIAVQVNGKVRAEVEVGTDADEMVVAEAAKKDQNVVKYLEGKEIKKMIYVKGKILSFVV